MHEATLMWIIGIVTQPPMEPIEEGPVDCDVKWNDCMKKKVEDNGGPFSNFAWVVTDLKVEYYFKPIS